VRKAIVVFCLALIGGSILIFTGCKVKITVPAGGKVISKSGAYECRSGQECVVDIYDLFFDEEFFGEPAPGYSFIKWRKVNRGLCGNTETPCRIVSAWAEIHENFMAVLQSDEVFYLEPIFAEPNTWSQLGEDIEDEANGHKFGADISLSAGGKRLAVVVRDNESNYGHVRVYQWIRSAWSQMGGPIYWDSNHSLEHASVSLSANGTVLAIGDPYSGGESGQVRVYKWSLDTWHQLGENIDDSRNGDHFGTSVSLSANGTRLAVGTRKNEYPLPANGYVRIYDYSEETDNWSQLGSQLVGERNYDEFGYSVSMSANGELLAVGAPSNDGDSSGYDFGHARVYRWSGVDWQKLGEDIDGSEEHDQFGFSVALSSDGRRLAIGAPALQDWRDSLGTAEGYVRVFYWTGGVWRQLGNDIVGEVGRDNVGFSVSLSSDGHRVAVGARSQFSREGHVYAYRHLQSDNSWIQDSRGLNMKEMYKTSFNHVSISADGKRLAAGVSGGSWYARIFEMLLETPK